jgi:hypothetical protein
MLRLATLLILVAVLLILLWSVQRRLIYFPFGVVPSPDEAGLPQAQNVTFMTADGLTLAGWFVPANESRVTVLFLGGNGGNRAMRAPLAARLAGRGIATLLVDYRGYGGNPGRPSEEGLARDARAARRYLGGRPDVDPARIVYFGESLGTAVAVRLAAEQPPMALILRSPFTSLADVGRYHYPFLPVRLLLRDRFASLERIPLVKSPTLVIAGRDDSIVPAPLSEQLFAAAPASPKQLLIVENADHNDYELLAGPRVIDAVVDFLNQFSSTTAARKAVVSTRD